LRRWSKCWAIRASPWRIALRTAADAAHIYDPSRDLGAPILCRKSNAVKLSSDPATPFLVGGKIRLSAYGMYGYALLAVPQ
jgi:hypothetical protein